MAGEKSALIGVGLQNRRKTRPILAGYGYGLRINDKAETYEIEHTGFHPSEGFIAVNLYYPKSKTSVVIMENIGNEYFDIAYYFEQEIRKIVKLLINEN